MSEDEVRALYEVLITGWNDHDGVAMAAPFAEDGTVIGFDGSIHAGKETIGTEMARIFADHETGRYSVKVRSVRAVGTDAMVLRSIAGLVPPGQTAINPRRTRTRPSSPSGVTAVGRSFSFRTPQPSSTAAPSWSTR